MYKGIITHRENGKLQKLEVTQEEISRLLEILARFNDLDIIEVHIIGA